MSIARLKHQAPGWGYGWHTTRQVSICPQETKGCKALGVDYQKSSQIARNPFPASWLSPSGMAMTGPVQELGFRTSGQYQSVSLNSPKANLKIAATPKLKESKAVHPEKSSNSNPLTYRLLQSSRLASGRQQQSSAHPDSRGF